MWPTSENMQLELNQMKQRIQHIKNQLQIRNSNEVNYEARNIRDVKVKRLNQYISRYEDTAVRKFYKKSMRLLETLKKKRKEQLKGKNNRKVKNSFFNRNSKIKDNIMCKSNIIDKINNTKNDTEIVTLDEDSSDSSYLRHKKSVTAPSNCSGKIISDSSAYQKRQMNKRADDSDVVYLETVKSKSLNHEMNIDHVISKRKFLNNTNSLVTAASINTSVSSCKIDHSKSNKIMPKENAKRSFDKKGKINSNNSRIIGDGDIICLQTVNKFSEFHSRNNKQSSCYIKKNFSENTGERKDCDSQIGSNLEFDKNPTKPFVNEKICQTVDSSSSNEIEFLEQVNNSEVIPEWDFTEEPVDFPIPLLHNHESLKISCEKLKELESKGAEIKTGFWSKEEKAILNRNFINFTDQFGVTNVPLLLGIGRQFSSDKQEFKNIKKFWKVKHFLLRLGKDLNNRSLLSIYQKARKLFYPLSRSYECSAEDISVLLTLQKKYGNHWHLIAKKFGRHFDVCHNLYLKYAKFTNKGKWSDEEVNKLIGAVKKVTKSKEISFENLKRISWNKVSEYVPTRNATQCCHKWHIIQKHKGTFKN